MKRIFSRLLIASLTLFIGITAATLRKQFWKKSAVSSPPASTKKESDDASWQKLLTFKDQLADVRMAADLRDSKTIKSIVKELVRADHRWIRDAARLTGESLVGMSQVWHCR
jgi:hypothetical protein